MDNLRDFVNKVSILQSQYSELYDEYEELVAISEEYIHLEPSGFMEVAQEYHRKPFISRRDSDGYPLEAQIFVDAVKFITIGTFEDFRGVGLL